MVDNWSFYSSDALRQISWLLFPRGSSDQRLLQSFLPKRDKNMNEVSKFWFIGPPISSSLVQVQPRPTGFLDIMFNQIHVMVGPLAYNPAFCWDWLMVYAWVQPDNTFSRRSIPGQVWIGPHIALVTFETVENFLFWGGGRCITYQHWYFLNTSSYLTF